MLSFKQMLNCAKRGDVEAIAYLYRHFLSGVFGYIYNRVPDRNTAEDLTSDVFLAMVDSIHKVKATSEPAFAAWLFKIAHITVASYYRTRERMPESLQEKQEYLEQFSSSDDPVQYLENCEDRRLLIEAMNTLTEEQRQVLVGRLILEYDAETVGRMIGKKANAVRALQFRALQALKRILSKKGDVRHEIVP
jgi:RNA polymerase sigma-70 factor (ECF subfamily)